MDEQPNLGSRSPEWDEMIRRLQRQAMLELSIAIENEIIWGLPVYEGMTRTESGITVPRRISSRTGGDRRTQMRLAPKDPASNHLSSIPALDPGIAAGSVPPSVACENCGRDGGSMIRNSTGQWVHARRCPSKRVR